MNQSAKKSKRIFKKLTEKEKQAEMKNMGSDAYERGQNAKFETLHVLDFGESLFNLSSGVGMTKKIETIQNLSTVE